MFFTLPLWIGKRFILGCNRKEIISFISLISTFGISFSVAIIIIVLSIMHGFEKELNRRIISVIPQIEIESIKYKNMNEWKNILLLVKKIPEVINATPYINFIGLIENERKLKAVQIKGIDPDLENQFSTLPNFVKNNAWSNFKNGKNHIIIGNDIAKYFGLKINDWITINFNITKNNKFLNPKVIYLKIIGILNTKGILDSTLTIIPLFDAQKYLEINNITGIAIKANNPFNINNLLFNIEKKIDFSFYTKSWIDKYGYIYRDITMIRTIVYIAMILIIVIACFNNISILMMIVKDKNKEIAILKILGTQNILIKKIFLWYGLIIGLLGSIIGVIVGVLISLNINVFLKVIEYFFGNILFVNSTYFIDFLPSELQWFDILYILLSTIVLSIIISLYPSKKANKITLIELLNKN